MNKPPLATDLNYILEHTAQVWDELRDARIFLTGGTGFFGKWLLDSFVWAKKNLKLNTTLTVLTRNFQSFKNTRPDLCSQPTIYFHEGDIRNFTINSSEKFSHIIHAATEASALLNANNPLLMIDTIIQGTKQTLDFATLCGAQKFLFISSGAIYGKQPSNIAHLAEDYLGAPSVIDLNSAYGNAKRMAEHMCIQFNKQHGLDIKIARCFAFVGPYLPLDTHFAIGNFIRDALCGQPIMVKGDGATLRSYMYTSELTIWLWHILCRGDVCSIYNVGSDQAISIADLAKTVAACFGNKNNVMINDKSNIATSRYVPSIERAKNELGLEHKINLEQAINLTKAWYQA